MDEIYARLDNRWVSKVINLKEKFNKLKNVTEILKPGNQERLVKYLSNPATRDERSELEKLDYYEKFSPLVSSYELMGGSLAEKGCVGLSITPELTSKLKTIKVLSKRRHKDSKSEEKAVALIDRKRKFNCIRKVNDEKLKPDLVPYEHLLITARVYHPFQRSAAVKTSVGPTLAQIITVLGEQVLTQFRDMIFCVNDHAIPGDRSEHLEGSGVTNKDKYPSGFLFIEKVFYNDMRKSNSVDYSEVVIKWLKGLSKKVEGISTADMDKVKFEDLSLRFGYPYVYVHQGNCEHLVVFSDATLLQSNSCLRSSNYPMLEYLYKKKSTSCHFCGHFVARWVVQDCIRIPHKMVYLCEKCLKMYCYVDGKKLGSFNVYEYIDPALVNSNKRILEL